MDSTIEKNTEAYDIHAKEWDLQMSYNLGHLYLEKPAMQKLIPDNLAHKSILSIGLGAGDELTDLIKQNPLKIVGIDISIELLKIAKDKFSSIEVVKADMMKLPFQDESFDFVYSSLAFHYANDWDILMTGINRVLKSGGLLLFSTHHPDHWKKKTLTGKSYTNPRNITLTEHTTMLPAGVEVTYYNHENIDSIIESVTHAGFEVLKTVVPEVVKPASLRKDLEDKYKSLVKNNSESPLFFIVLAKKR